MKDANELLVSAGPKVFLEQWGKARARVRDAASAKATAKTSVKASEPGSAVPDSVTAPRSAVSKRPGSRVTARVKVTSVPPASPKVEESFPESMRAAAPEATLPAGPPPVPVPDPTPAPEPAPAPESAAVSGSATEAVLQAAVPPAPEAAKATATRVAAGAEPETAAATTLPPERSAVVLTPEPACAPGACVPSVPVPQPVAAVTPLPAPAAPVIPAVLPLSPEFAAKEENQLLARDSAGAYVFTPGPRTWRVKGLSAFGADRLRVNVRVDEAGRFHVDTFDLYAARSRHSFTEAAAIALRLDDESKAAIGDELALLIDALEKERLSLRSQGDTKAKPYVMSAAEHQEAMAFLLGKIRAGLKADFLAAGLVGEEVSMLTGYYSLISRKLAEPLSVLFCARSGAGKSTLQDRLCDLCPEEDLVKYTRISGQVLFYKDEEALKHKLLAVDEEDGVAQAAYALRNLLSSGYLSCSVTRTDPQTGRQVAEDRRVEGPTTVFLTSAHPEALDYETRNRFLLLTVDESMEQTRRILEQQRFNQTLEGLLAREKRKAIFKKHHNIQRLLRPLEVVIPFPVPFPASWLILRREQPKYQALIKSIALMCQHQRKVKTLVVDGRTVEYIEATEEDVALAKELAMVVLKRNLDELAPPCRSLYVAMRDLARAKRKAVSSAQNAAGRETEGKGERRYILKRRAEDEPDERLLLDRREIQRATGLQLWHIKTYMPQLVEYGYVRIVSGRKGKRLLYEVLFFDDEEGDEPLAM